MNMPKGMQIYKMKQDLLKMGISPDTVDLEALVDGRITYGENLKNIERKIGISHSRKQTGTFSKAKHKKTLNAQDAMGLAFEKEHAMDRHQRRSLLSVQMDESKKAKHTLTDRQILDNHPLLQKWYKQPNRYDIQGIDD